MKKLILREAEKIVQGHIETGNLNSSFFGYCTLLFKNTPYPKDDLVYDRGFLLKESGVMHFVYLQVGTLHWFVKVLTLASL